MSECKCGFTTDPDKQCNGTHKVVKAVKDQIAQKIEQSCTLFNNSLSSCSMAGCSHKEDAKLVREY